LSAAILFFEKLVLWSLEKHPLLQANSASRAYTSYFFFCPFSIEMIENYFIKHSKRKNQEENDQPLEGQARKIPKKDPLPSLLKEPPLDLAGDKPPTQHDIFTVLKNLPELKWRKITAENLNLEYAIMFTKNEAYKIFNYLENEIVYEHNSKVQVFGKWHNVPRKQASYGDDGLKYSFSGRTISATPWTPFLRELRDMLATKVGTNFNFVLINRYKDGNDHIGEHKDDEHELVSRSPIASLSFGEARDFVFRHQDSRGAKAVSKIEPVKLNLQAGSILLMNYPTNSYWYHSLPVRKKCLGPRINLTFRQMHC
jgi:alpha-ketoglutarate-dependent dioxygenase alkB family protein 2